jgi:glycine/D-amino acid oxidase-like deaminating enzyme
VKRTGSGDYDTIIIGGGFYGLRIAQFLKEELNVDRILVIEKDDQLMTRASYNNQARVHNGYHYPRSVLTALRSRVNFPIFVKEYRSAIQKDFDEYYGVAANLSNVTARQFENFFKKIGAEITRAPEASDLFDRKMIEGIFKVKEYVFDSNVIRESLIEKLAAAGVEVHVGEAVKSIATDKTAAIRINSSKTSYTSKFVINTTYSSINLLNKTSGLPVIPLKHELTELCLVTMPPLLEHKAFTVMCGPFFSIMPFPAEGVYTMSHVRYTPHLEWQDSVHEVNNAHEVLNASRLPSHFPQMLADICRYIPGARDITYTGKSLWEIKTVLPQSEADDSRPILYKAHHGLRNYICIMGGKMDNIYDVFRELRLTYASS